MKKIFLSLALTLGCITSEVEGLGSVLAGVAENVEKRIAAGRPIGIDPDILVRIPEVTEVISPNTEIRLCTDAAKKYIDGKWKGRSIEELLSRIDGSMPLKTCDLLDISEAYNWRSVGRCFSQWQIFGYGFGKGSLYKSTLDNALSAIFAANFGTDAKIRDIASDIDGTSHDLGDTNHVERGSTTIWPGGHTYYLAIGTKENHRLREVTYQHDGELYYIPIDEFNQDFAGEAINAAARAAVEVVVFNINASNDKIYGAAFRAAKEFIITQRPDLNIEIVDAVSNAIKEALSDAIIREPEIFDTVKSFKDITNVHRLYLMGAMQAIIEGKGIPLAYTQAEAADGNNGKN